MKNFLIAVLLFACVLPAVAGERAMSEPEKQELRQSIGKILAYFEESFGLKAKSPIQLEFTTPEKILEVAQQEAAQEDATTRRAVLSSELLLKKLGFVPRDFDLTRYRVQSSPKMRLAYYNHDDKKLYLLDTLAKGQREAVLVHELMHAVEDEHVPLGPYMRGGTEEQTLMANLDEERYDPNFDDGVLARQAVIEGHAMFATRQYLYLQVENAPRSRSYSVQQEFNRLMSLAFPSLRKESKELLKRTPPYILRISEFPYWSGGYTFVHELNERGGRKLAFDKALEQPPSSTRQILMPEKFASGETAPRLRLPKLGPLLAGHKLLRVETAGQFDVMLLADQFAGSDTAAKLGPKWRGGTWYIFTRASGQKPDMQDVELVYVSQWQNEGAAQDFAKLYGKAVAKKYGGAREAREGERRVWQTSDGLVSVEAAGDCVLVMESFEATDAERLRAALLGAQEK
jgi:hypothetical protein